VIISFIRDIAFYYVIVFEKILTMKEQLRLYPLKVVASLHINTILTVSHICKK